MLYDQVSKLSGRFDLLTNAEYTPNFFRKLSEGSEISEGSEFFGRFRKFRKVPKSRKIWNLVTRFGMQDQEPRRFWNILRTTTIKKNISIVYYIRKGSEISASGKKSSEIFGNLGTYHKITEILEGFRNVRNFVRKGRSALITEIIPNIYK